MKVNISRIVLLTILLATSPISCMDISAAATGFLTALRQNAPQIAVGATFVLSIAGAATGAAAVGTVAERRGTFQWIDDYIITNKDSGTVVVAAAVKSVAGFLTGAILPLAAEYGLFKLLKLT